MTSVARLRAKVSSRVRKHRSRRHLRKAFGGPKLALPPSVEWLRLAGLVAHVPVIVLGVWWAGFFLSRPQDERGGARRSAGLYLVAETLTVMLIMALMWFTVLIVSRAMDISDPLSEALGRLMVLRPAIGPWHLTALFVEVSLLVAQFFASTVALMAALGLVVVAALAVVVRGVVVTFSTASPRRMMFSDFSDDELRSQNFERRADWRPSDLVAPDCNTSVEQLTANLVEARRRAVSVKFLGLLLGATATLTTIPLITVSVRNGPGLVQAALVYLPLLAFIAAYLMQVRATNYERYADNCEALRKRTLLPS